MSKKRKKNKGKKAEQPIITPSKKSLWGRIKSFFSKEENIKKTIKFLATLVAASAVITLVVNFTINVNSPGKTVEGDDNSKTIAGDDNSTTINGGTHIEQLVYNADTPLPTLDNINNDYESGMRAFNEHSYEAALVHFKNTLKSQRFIASEETLDIGRTHEAIGITYLNLGDYSSSADSLNDALSFYERVDGDHRADIGRLYYYSALAYHGLGNLEKATEKLEKTCNIIFTDPLDPAIFDYCADVFLEYGRIKSDLGEFGLAVAYIDCGLNIIASSEQNLDKRDSQVTPLSVPYDELRPDNDVYLFYTQGTELAALLCNRAIPYIALAEYEKAERDTKLAMKILEAVPVDHRNSLAICYDNLNILSAGQEDFDAALQYAADGIDHMSKQGLAQHPFMAQMYEHQGNTLVGVGRKEDARRSYETAIEIYNASGKKKDADAVTEMIKQLDTSDL